MKYLLAGFLLMVSLTGCTGVSALERHNCSFGGEVCIEVRAAEPISFGGQVTATITVTSKNDILDLGVSLSHDVDVIVEGPMGWEKNIMDVTIDKSGADWKTTLEAARPLTFTRKLDLPPREGGFLIIASAVTSDLRAVDSITIYMTREGGKVYLPGTKIPVTEGPLPTMNPSMLATARAWPTTSPFPPLPAEKPTASSYPTKLAASPTQVLPTVIPGTPAYPAPLKMPYP